MHGPVLRHDLAEDVARVAIDFAGGAALVHLGLQPCRIFCRFAIPLDQFAGIGVDAGKAARNNARLGPSSAMAMPTCFIVTN